MENYIISKYGNTRLFLSRKAVENLEKYAPKGCPFKGYTLFDLVKDFHTALISLILIDTVHEIVLPVDLADGQLDEILGGLGIPCLLLTAV